MLQDGFGRTIEYLRLSVTDRCDLRCTYCMPEKFKDYSEPEHWLSFDEIERLLSVFARLGLRRIRLTGGEPLLRKNLPELASRLSRLPGIDDLSLSTNGTQLERYAGVLRRAGVTRLNVSLDSLDRERVQSISKRDVMPQVLAGLEAARNEGFRLIKINMVAMSATTDDEIDAMTAYCIERGFVLRLIETMPVGEGGRNTGFLDLRPVQERLRRRFGLVDGVVPGGGPARYLVSGDGRFQIGFITPITQHFCATCNRVRLGVDGILYLCLGQNHTVDFRTLLRSGGSNADIEEAVLAALRTKPHSHDFTSRPQRVVRVMSATGG
ncbi:MAG: GTP 3',8-cyclase MoaA [Proteobacteria bacterium]|nr:GTP 3',8-cyclase MoaA [Pseudomonadota bacterium]